MTDIDSDDGFVMNIQSNINSVPKKKSLIDKKKEKKEKYLERKRYKIQKRKEELNDKKREKENKNNQSINIISSYRPPRTQKPIIENSNKTNNETNIDINEEMNNNISKEKIPKKKITNNQKLKQQKHREQLMTEIQDELDKINKEKKNEMNIEDEDNKNKIIEEEEENIDKINKKEIKNEKESNKKNISQSKSVFSIKTFEDLQIDQYLKKALIKQNYSTMTKIQKKSIPILLQHKNVIIKSETGSGKTLAYVIPLYEYLIKINKEESINRKNGIYTIIFAPTHELCLQIEETFNKLKSCCINIVFGTLMGGQKIDREKQKLRKGCNILICTPGRLLYHLKNTEKLNFDNLKVIIFDEADLLLNMGFEKDIKSCFIEIFKKNYEVENDEIELNPDIFKKYKIFLISATIDNKIRRFTNYIMKGFKTVGFEQEKKNNENKDENNIENKDENEVEIKKNPNENLEKISTSNTIQQYFSYVNDEFRLITLIAFLYNNTGKKIMIFMSTCDGVNFITNLLNNIEIDINYRIEPKESNRKLNNKLLNERPNKKKIIKSNIYKLHGKMKHDERKEIFTKFNLDNSGILISTDVAARGLDFPNVEWVIHYDINPDLKEYVNRMGRTARLDNLGNSLLFIMENERELLYNSFNKIKGDIKEIVNSNILLEFVQNLNNNLLKTKIEFIPMPFDNEVDENEKFRKKFIFAILPLQKIVKDFIFSNKENMILAQRAFKSELKAYATFIKYGKKIFNIKVLNLTRLSRSFGLYKETSKIKIGNTQVNIDYQYEKTKVKAEKKYNNKNIQNRIMMSEFDS